MTTNLTAARAFAVLLAVALGLVSALLPWLQLIPIFLLSRDCTGDAGDCLGSLLFAAIHFFWAFIALSLVLVVAGLVTATRGVLRLRRHYRDSTFSGENLIMALDPVALGLLAGGLALLGPALSLAAAFLRTAGD